MTATLGEFPDEDAEREYRAWVKAGRPRPERRGRPPRGAGHAGPDETTSEAFGGGALGGPKRAVRGRDGIPAASGTGQPTGRYRPVTIIGTKNPNKVPRVIPALP